MVVELSCAHGVCLHSWCAAQYMEWLAATGAQVIPGDGEGECRHSWVNFDLQLGVFQVCLHSWYATFNLQQGPGRAAQHTHSTYSTTTEVTTCYYASFGTRAALCYLSRNGPIFGHFLGGPKYRPSVCRGLPITQALDRRTLRVP